MGRVAFKRVSASALILIAAAGFAVETSRDSYSAQTPKSSTSIVGGTSTTTSSSTTSTPTTTTTAPTTGSTVSTRIEDPFHSPALAAYLDSRTDNVTAALYDVTTHQTYIYRPGIREVTASMVKIDILADMLWQSQNSHVALSAKEQTLATAMVEESDNTAAESLWEEIGQLPAITVFNQQMHFTQSIPNWDWGLFDTTPRDELNLLKTIVLPNEVLTPASQEYEQDLMEHVVDYERFGIPTGVPANATVGVKNGWYPESTTGWQINSAGYVHLGRTYYLAVVMTASNSGEAYGDEVVDRVGQAFWNFEKSRSAL